MTGLMEERREPLSAVPTRKSLAETSSQPQHEGREPLSLLTWLATAGKFMLGLMLTVVGLLVRVVLAVTLLAAPFIALVGTVFLFALMIEGTGAVLRAIGLTP